MLVLLLHDSIVNYIINNMFIFAELEFLNNKLQNMFHSYNVLHFNTCL
jgi:hypothetical protein